MELRERPRTAFLSSLSALLLDQNSSTDPSTLFLLLDQNIKPSEKVVIWLGIHYLNYQCGSIMQTNLQ